MENISNQVFNKLTAIKPIFRYKREWVWECKCKCGRKTKVRISKLKNGYTKSCGCLKKPKTKYGKEHKQWSGFGDISKSFYSRIKNSALQRNIIFQISIEYLWELYQKQEGKCAYTGKEIKLPVFVRQLRGENNEDIASLDRINPESGYIKENLQWICKRINYMKHTMNEEYFLNWIKDIYNFKFKEN
jgi:hypothetical protein